MTIKFPSLKEIFAGVVISFFLVQIISVLITSIFPSVPILRGGNAILLMLLSIGIIALFNIGFNLGDFKKEQLVFIIIVFGIIAFVFWKGQDYFPNLFSISPEFSNSIKNAIGSIIAP